MVLRPLGYEFDVRPGGPLDEWDRNSLVVHGRVRLPGKQNNPGRMAAMKLVDEVTKWPEGNTDDCVMAQWFFEYQLPNIHTPYVEPPQRFVPSWQRSKEFAWNS